MPDFIHYVPEDKLESVRNEGIKSLGARLRSGDPEAAERLLSYARFLKNKKKATTKAILKAIIKKRKHPKGPDAVYGFPGKPDISRSERLKEWLSGKVPVKVKVNKLLKDKLLEHAENLDAPEIAYEKIPKTGPALANIPHPRIIPKKGVIPPEYLEVLDKQAGLSLSKNTVI